MRFGDLLLNLLELIMFIAPIFSKGNLGIAFLILNQEIIKMQIWGQGTCFPLLNKAYSPDFKQKSLGIR